MNEVTLEKLKYVIYAELSEEMVDDLANMPAVELSQHCNFMADSVAMKIKGQILGREIERIETRYPADWWQAFKERWFPEWLKGRYPVVYVQERLVARELYPMLPIPGYEPAISLEKKRWENRKDG